jgi:hypothetical protein
MIDGENKVPYMQLTQESCYPPILSALDPFKKDIQGVRGGRLHYLCYLLQIIKASGILKCILFFIKTEFPYQGCYDCAYNGCDEKEPELGEGFPAGEKGRA